MWMKFGLPVDFETRALYYVTSTAVNKTAHDTSTTAKITKR